MTALLTQDFDDLPVVMRVSARARRISLRIDTHARTVVLTRPRRVAKREALAFLKTRDAWVRKHLATLHPPVPFEAGQTLPVQGVACVIVQGDSTRKRSRVTLADGALVHDGLPENIAAATHRFLLQQARDVITAEVVTLVGTQPVPDIRIGDPKTRWGSCQMKRAGLFRTRYGLSFSWRLILMPPEILHYVVAHEVAHMKHMDHSPAFWAHCRALADLSEQALEQRRTWLRINGSRYYRYG